MDDEVERVRTEPSPSSNPRFACSPELDKKEQNNKTIKIKNVHAVSFTMQKNQQKSKKYARSVGLCYMGHKSHQTQGMGQKWVPKPRDFCLVVTMTETGWGPRFPFLA